MEVPDSQEPCSRRATDATPSHLACRSHENAVDAVSFQIAASSSVSELGAPERRYAPWATRSRRPTLQAWERAFLLMPRRCAWAVVKTPSDAESSSMAAMLFAYFMLRLYENFRHLQHRSVTRRLCN